MLGGLRMQLDVLGKHASGASHSEHPRRVAVTLS